MAEVLFIIYPTETKHELEWILIKDFGFRIHRDFKNIFYDNVGNLIHLRNHEIKNKRYNFFINYVENYEKKETFRIYGYDEFKKFLLNLKNPENYERMNKNSGKPNNSTD